LQRFVNNLVIQVSVVIMHLPRIKFGVEPLHIFAGNAFAEIGFDGVDPDVKETF
jgi:hypothetical protein